MVFHASSELRVLQMSGMRFPPLQKRNKNFQQCDMKKNFMHSVLVTSPHRDQLCAAGPVDRATATLGTSRRARRGSARTGCATQQQRGRSALKCLDMSSVTATVKALQTSAEFVRVLVHFIGQGTNPETQCLTQPPRTRCYIRAGESRQVPFASHVASLWRRRRQLQEIVPFACCVQI